MAGRRHQKDWFDREKKVMEKLGLRPQPQSGAGWRKEDGENDYVLCQLKSTDGKLNKRLEKLLAPDELKDIVHQLDKKEDK